MRYLLAFGLLCLALGSYAQINPNKPKPAPASKPKPPAVSPDPVAIIPKAMVVFEWQGERTVKLRVGNREVALESGASIDLYLETGLYTLEVVTPKRTFTGDEFLTVQANEGIHVFLRLEGDLLLFDEIPLSEVADYLAKKQAQEQLELDARNRQDSAAVKRVAAEERDKHDPYGIAMNMVRIDSGTFMMGCTSDQGNYCRNDEFPAHQVKVSTFYLSKYEVTQDQWKMVMDDNPSKRNTCGKCPVENVSWFDAQVFIRKLNEATGHHYRLPTEAEWEFAARGGNKGSSTMFPGGNDPSSLGWYEGNSNGTTLFVGQKQPNELGLFDMCGNVVEWCSDWYGESYYGKSPSNDPPGPENGEYRVVRSCTTAHLAKFCRVATRMRLKPDYSNWGNCGFRLARTE